MPKADDLKERVLSLAVGEGIKYGLIGATTAGVGTYVATIKSDSFRKYMSVSAKSSLPLMAGIFLFVLQYELTIHDANRFPEKWGLSEKNINKGIVVKAPAHHKVMNYLYDHPFSFIAGVGAPFAALILSKQMKLTHLKISQRIMHTRIYAQGGIVSIALMTMAFREYMNNRGRFPDDSNSQQLDKELIVNSRSK